MNFEICNKYINRYYDVECNLKKYGLPPSNLFINYMKQFVYRYLIFLGKWNAHDKLWIEYEKDESFDKYTNEIVQMIKENIKSHNKLNNAINKASNKDFYNEYILLSDEYSLYKLKYNTDIKGRNKYKEKDLNKIYKKVLLMQHLSACRKSPITNFYTLSDFEKVR